MPERPPDFPLPPHVYVPGLTPRHPPDIFAKLKSSVALDTPPAELHKTRAFMAGLIYFEAGYFWESYEVLDVVWRQTKDPSAERDMVLALIQLANARLKVLLNQPRAAWRLCDMIETHLLRCPKDRAVLGLQVDQMLSKVSEARQVAKAAM